MVRITRVRKQLGNNSHLGLMSFQWINEQTQQTGQTDLPNMYDWIVNKKGQAYIRDTEGNQIAIFGAVSPNGQTYLRAVKNGAWSDDLLNLPTF